MQHPKNDSGSGTRGRDEDLADMYLNWVLDMNPNYPKNGFSSDDWGTARRDMMNEGQSGDYPRGMPEWLHLMGLR